MNPDLPLKVVAIGGGTGQAALLRALKLEAGRPRSPWTITGIVTVSDNGGSSGRLRTELGSIPPGDLRNCLTALIREDSSLSELMSFRFPGDGALGGHALGNLILLAMAEITGSWVKALKELSASLVTLGRLYPSTLTPVHLMAEDMAGNRYEGETSVNDSHPPLARLWLEPMDTDPLPEAMLAILQADVILLAPGSLYTSTIPNLLIDELRDAISRSGAPVVYIANLMTEPGETAGLSLEDHLAAIQAFGHVGLDAVIANRAPLPAATLERYRHEGGRPLAPAGAVVCGVPVHACSLVDPDSVWVRHHPERLAGAIRSCIETL
nr:uridine diphosphate-N-acetylglucosamine-binding protein YvcK [uncultured Holophaga sp.]